MEGIREIKSAHEERRITTWNGFMVLAIGLALVAFGLWQLFQGVGFGRSGAVTGLVTSIVIFVLLFIAGLLFLSGLYTLQPNEAALLQLFGSYRGTTRVAGLRGTNPFYTRRKVSLRARNLNGERLKVNDKRGNPIEIAAVVVDEARLMHLAYAPEIAQVMLRRQQAEAIIAARQKIVHGAVSMVEMALRELSEKKVVELDDERKAAMVSNLMTVLCAESEVQPVINTGTLYHYPTTFGQ